MSDEQHRHERKIPRLHETDGIFFEDKQIWLHFFLNDSHWYVAEFDGEETFFGYVVLNGDTNNAEWGYFTWSELKSVLREGCGVEMDGRWQTKTLAELEIGSSSSCSFPSAKLEVP